MPKNKRVESVKEALRQPCTWPGMYTKRFVVHDGLLCESCIRSNIRVVFNDTRMNVGPWNVQVDVLWEGPTVSCVDCGESVESEYGE